MRAAIQRFVVTAELGRGGMGAVYLARDPRLERDVAIKLLEGQVAARGPLTTHATIDLRDRVSTHDDLLAEARMMARLSHPNVLPIYEVGLEDDCVFLVMEYAAGGSLRAWLEREPRPDAAILDMFAQAAHGLAAAHAHGIVHRDFKPDNVLLGADGRARVADFGLAGLVAASQLVHAGDGRGTPRYMAPELWRDEPPSPASDVFALCRAIADAFGETGEASAHDAATAPGASGRVRGSSPDPRGRDHGRSPVPSGRDARPSPDPSGRGARSSPDLGGRGGPPSGDAAFARVPAHAREVIRAGLSADPAARPPLGAVIAALAPPPPALAAAAPPRRGRAWRFAAAGGGATVAVVAIALATGGGDEPAAPCGGDRTRAELDRSRAALAAARPAVAPKLDPSIASIAGAWRGLCEARDRGEVGAPRAEVHGACLDRRAIETRLVVERVLAHPAWTDADAEAAVTIDPPPVAPCTEVDAPAIADRARTEALYRALVGRVDLAPAALVPAMTALERDAQAAGEAEVEIRAAITLAGSLRTLDRLAEADAVFQRAYRRAVAIQSTTQQAIALAQRSWLAANMGRARESESFAQLAFELAERPALVPRTRVRLYAVRAQSLLDQGKAALAREVVDQGLAVVAQSGERMPDIEIDLRVAQIDAALQHDAQSAKAVELAREHVAWTRAQFGAESSGHGYAINVLAATLERRGERADAAALRREALAVLSTALGPDHSSTLAQRDTVARDLARRGDHEGARAEYADLLARSERNEGLAPARPGFRRGLAEALLDAGRVDEGLQQMRRALDDYIAMRGADHPATLGARMALAAWLLHAERLDDAAREIDTLADLHRRAGDDRRSDQARVSGLLGAQLDRWRGDLPSALRRAREALATLRELRTADADQLDVLWSLGSILGDSGRLVEAREVLERVLALSVAQGERADETADVQLELAAVRLAQGDRAAARELAEHARAAYEQFRSHPRELRRALAILARTAPAPASTPSPRRRR